MRTLRRVILLVAASAVGIASAVAASAHAGTAEPPARATEVLRDLRETLRRADDQNGDPGNPLNDLIREAARTKHRFVRVAFREQRLFGCPGHLVFELLESVDVSLAEAALERRPRARTGILEAALFFAKELRDTLAECEGAGGARAEDRADLIVKRVRHLVDADERGDVDAMAIDEAADEVRADKRSLLERQRVYECAAFRFYLLIERIDVQLALARRASGNVSRDHERQYRRDQVATALDLARELQREWREVPCGEASPPPEVQPPG
jgi:hypothetical protein